MTPGSLACRKSGFSAIPTGNLWKFLGNQEIVVEGLMRDALGTEEPFFTIATTVRSLSDQSRPTGPVSFYYIMTSKHIGWFGSGGDITRFYQVYEEFTSEEATH